MRYRWLTSLILLCTVLLALPGLTAPQRVAPDMPAASVTLHLHDDQIVMQVPLALPLPASAPATVVLPHPPQYLPLTLCRDIPHPPNGRAPGAA